VLQGLGTVATSYLAPVTPGFHDAGGYGYDPDKAKQLLKDAGFPNGFSTTMWVPTGRYFQGEQTAQAVQGYLSAVGVKAKLVPMEFGAFISAITQPKEKNQSEMFLLGWEAYPDPSWITANVFGTAATPPGSWNTMFFSDPGLDQLISQLQAASDPTERQTLYDQIQNQVVKDAPWIFLHSAKSVWGARADLKGIQVLPDDTLVLHDVKLGS
jgi:ABC-type transport system substrate-binding protein